MKISRATVLLVILLLGGCGDLFQTRPLPTVDPEVREQLVGWLEVNGKPPSDYVVDLFTDHDVVFLGEFHRIKHDLELVESLLAPLHEAGVRTLATEFGRREDQALIDSLLNSPEWDEILAREITFRFSISWGYQEYVDIYRSAWKLNRSLPDGAPRFRILALNDSPDWSHIKTAEDRNSSDIMRQVWSGGGEKYWAAVILEAVESGAKVVVHSGIHHAFTAYRQPILVDGKFSHFDHSLRCGNHVFAEIGKRAITVFLHGPWRGAEGYGSPLGYPADGIIDALMKGSTLQPVGFDLDRGPLGELDMGDAIYRHGYENPRLKQYCDGWIFTKSFSDYEGASTIPEWINGDNLDRARLGSPNPKRRQASSDRFNRGIARSADIPRRLRHLR